MDSSSFSEVRGNGTGNRAETTSPTYTLIIPTKDRSYHLGRRLPGWARMRFDEVIVVDSSQDSGHRKANERLCARLGVKYLFLRGNRSEARNLGARAAKGSWILFTDDDGSGSTTFHREELDARASGHDWLKASRSEEVTIFNRDFFVRIGGYHPNLVLGEDDDLTARAIASGKGGPIEGVFGTIDYSPDEWELRHDFMRRLSNYIEYSFTLWEYAKQAESPAKTVYRWCLAVVQVGREALRGDLRALPYFLGALGGIGFGLLFSSLRRSARPERAPN